MASGSVDKGGGYVLWGIVERILLEDRVKGTVKEK